MATKRRKREPAGPKPIPRLSIDQAFIGLLIGAMEANHHVSPEEAARAQHMMWSMKRFRRKSGEVVGKVIADMKAAVSLHGGKPVVAAASRAIPRRLREAAFAIVTDLVLVDGTLEASERRFLFDVAADFGLGRARAAQIVDVMRVKNAA